MAIQKIEVIDNNKVGDCDLLAVHNPLVYTIKMTLDDSGDDYDDVIEVDVNISGNETEFIGTYYATFLRADNTNERIYIFQADEILRSGLNTIEDYTQDFNDKSDGDDSTIDEYIGKGYYFTFRADSSGTPIELIETLTAVHAVRGFEDDNGASMTTICENESKIYVGAKNKEVYTYEYDGNEFFTWGFLLEDLDVDGHQLDTELLSPDNKFTTFDGSYGFFRGGLGINNNPTRGVYGINPILKNTPTLSNEVQIGANKAETISNIFAYLETLDIVVQPFQTKNNNDEDIILYTINDEWYRPYGFTYVRIFLEDFTDPSDDGNNFRFRYYDSDGIEQQSGAMTARVTPTQTNYFEITSDYSQLTENIFAAIINTFPYYSDFDYGKVYRDDLSLPSQYGWYMYLQEPQTNSYAVGEFEAVQGEITALIENEWEWNEYVINPVFTRKKVLVPDSLDPIEVNMRTVNHVVFPKEFCDDSLYLKYVDKNGQYRFMVCEKPTKTTSPKNIGNIERLVTSLRTDLGNNINVGKNGNTYITVNLNNLRSDLSVNIDGTDYYLDEIALLEDLYNSPDIQLEIVPDKWISVSIAGSGQISKPKGTVYSTTLKLELPKKYNITKL